MMTNKKYVCPAPLKPIGRILIKLNRKLKHICYLDKMKVPTNCPICRGTMKNRFYYHAKSETLEKECHEITHHIKYTVDPNKNIILDVKLRVWKKDFIWIPPCEKKIDSKFVIIQGTSGEILPYFEPNFSNYSALLNKLKTYMLFL